MTPRPDAVRTMRGLLTGLALAAPLWAAALFVIWSHT